MTELLPRAVLEATDISEITQLILRERSSRDLGLWKQMRACFHIDSRVRLSWIDASGPEFVSRSQEMARRNVRASHRFGPIRKYRSKYRDTGKYRDTIPIYQSFSCVLLSLA